MARFLLFLVLCFTASNSFGQDFGQLPVSWSQDLRSNNPPIELPALDMEGIAAEDAINDRDKSLPWRYGISREIELDPTEDGMWTTLPNGDRIWQVAIKSPRAINLSVNFDDFYLPEGSFMHLYNNDRSEVSRGYFNSDNRDNKLLGSWFVSGDIIWVEYFEPKEVMEEFQLGIGSIIHGYRMGRVEGYVDRTMRGLNDSGDCNYDVNCPVGADFDEKKEILKKTVALLNLGNGYLCSASLINNTSGDKRPFLLTGNHCLNNSDPSFWSVRFNWVSPGPVCGAEDPSANISSNFTMSGASLRASNELSDFALVELFNPIPDTWDVAFAGWDNTDNYPSYEVGIHHPNGDIMKICRDDSGAVHEIANGVEVWLVGGVSAGTGNGWEIGTTESGSSGSPLFDQEGRIIGQLYGGEAFCDGIQNNNDYDVYGRFAVSWDAGSTPETRLRDWLDPIGTGQVVLESVQNILSVPDNQIAGSLEIYPNPASTEITVMNGRFPNLTYNFYDVVGKEIASGSLSNTMNTIRVDNLMEGVYFLYLFDQDSGQNSTRKIIVNR